MADQQKYINKLNGSRILIIGGSSGIGYTVAEATLEHGANVTISSSNPHRVQGKVEQLKKAYPSAANRIRGLTVDLSKPDTVDKEIENLFKNTVKTLEGGKIDHVIFTAADPLAMMELKDLNLEKIIAAGQLRFFAPLLVGKYVEQYLEKSSKSSYTITTGVISEKPVPGWSVIAAYAGGHHAMVKNLVMSTPLGHPPSIFCIYGLICRKK
jgi:NAD(P)-dependent dehydrogenase (short-subunit alcohol dehydrogenase family)